jgi:hypothetical protein
MAHRGTATAGCPCETCFNSDDTDDVIVRKVLQAPDMEISEGGKATPKPVREFAAAVSELQDATEH